MKKSLLTILVAVIAIFAFAPNANAQFKWGPRVGINVNSLKFSRDIVSTSNRVGFNIGAMCEFTAPVLGIGVDAALTYSRKNVDSEYVADMNYIEIPINFKYKFNIPAVNHIVRPFLTTGPSFAFLCNSSTFRDIYSFNNCDVAWNFGFGLEIINHLQLAASYGFDFTKVVSNYRPSGTGTDYYSARNRCWNITLAYLF